MHIALYQPDIPQNLGSILRLCACMDVACHIIEPCGFVLDDKRLKRVAMDYADHVSLHKHASWERFTEYAHSLPARVILLTTKGATNLYDFTFRSTDILLLGRESAGVPDEVTALADAKLRIPLAPHARSLNVAVTAGMALGEALRQTR